MGKNFAFLTAALLNSTWAMMPDRLEAMVEVFNRRFGGEKLDRDEIDAIKGERPYNGVLNLYEASTGMPIEAAAARGGTQTNGIIAVINVMGVIAQHASQVDDVSGRGGTSTERILGSFRSALQEPNMRAIVLNIDSPGGNVNGVQVLADEIFASRGTIPIVAQVNSMAASAAYWIACSCDEIVMAPGSNVGSIGIYGMHKDVSVAAEKEGIKFTFVSAGKFKVEGNPFEPLNDEAKAAMQEPVNDYYRDFVNSVARGRGVAASDVVAGFGEGRTVKDRRAIKAGMADRLGTLDDTLKRLSRSKKTNGNRADGGFELIANENIDDVVIEEPKEVAPSEDVAPMAALEQPAVVGVSTEDTDAFRRRRHAHRMRSMMGT